jgi:hypothetical protein
VIRLSSGARATGNLAPNTKGTVARGMVLVVGQAMVAELKPASISSFTPLRERSSAYPLVFCFAIITPTRLGARDRVAAESTAARRYAMHGLTLPNLLR